MALFSVKIDALNPEVLEQFSELGDEFTSELGNTFKQLLYDANKYLIRVTPVDTGELRGGWTAFLDAERVSYARQMLDTSLTIRPARTKKSPRIDPSAVEKGKRKSRYVFPNSLTWALVNEVPHGFYVEHGTSKTQGQNFTALTRYKAELRARTIFTDWFDAIAREGRVVPFKSNDEDINF